MLKYSRFLKGLPARFFTHSHIKRNQVDISQNDLDIPHGVCDTKRVRSKLSSHFVFRCIVHLNDSHNIKLSSMQKFAPSVDGDVLID